MHIPVIAAQQAPLRPDSTPKETSAAGAAPHEASPTSNASAPAVGAPRPLDAEAAGVVSDNLEGALLSSKEALEDFYLHEHPARTWRPAPALGRLRATAKQCERAGTTALAQTGPTRDRLTAACLDLVSTAANLRREPAVERKHKAELMACARSLTSFVSGLGAERFDDVQTRLVVAGHHFLVDNLDEDGWRRLARDPGLLDALESVPSGDDARDLLEGVSARRLSPGHVTGYLLGRIDTIGEAIMQELGNLHMPATTTLTPELLGRFREASEAWVAEQAPERLADLDALWKGEAADDAHLRELDLPDDFLM